MKVRQVDQAKLLGITFNEKQNWNSQIQGIGGVVSSLNKRMIIRLKNHIGPNSLKKVVDGFYLFIGRESKGTYMTDGV